jgi:hypothetical protein
VKEGLEHEWQKKGVALKIKAWTHVKGKRRMRLCMGEGRSAWAKIEMPMHALEKKN